MWTPIVTMVRRMMLVLESFYKWLAEEEEEVVVVEMVINVTVQIKYQGECLAMVQLANRLFEKPNLCCPLLAIAAVSVLQTLHPIPFLFST